MSVINSEEVLLNFLVAGLIDVKGDDEKLVKLQEVAAQLANNLENDPALALPYVLVALDPDIAATNDLVIKVLAVLSKSWLTYRNTFQQTPVQVVRAILLEALMRAMPYCDHIALIIAICARNLLPHRQLSHEQEIWSSVLFSAEQQVDSRAAKDWTTPSAIKIASFNVEGLEPINIKQQSVAIEEGDLQLDCVAAVVKTFHSAGKNTTVENGNPYALSNHPAQWATHFGIKMAKVISTNINEAISGTAIEEVDLAAPIERIAVSLTGYLETTFTSFAAATSGLERRTNLLWWKEAMFSSYIGQSYRTLEPQSAATLMAYDLYNQLPCFAPASVAAFLHEAVHALTNTGEIKSYSIVEWVGAVNNDTKLAPLRNTIESILPKVNGRGLIVELLAKNITDVGILEETLGIDAGVKLTMAGWSQWLLGDLMVLEAVEQAKSVTSVEEDE